MKQYLKWQYILVALLLLPLFVALYLYATLPDVEPLANSNPQTTSLIEQRKAEATEKGQRLRVRQTWVTYNRIPDLMKKAVRITEDASFFDHEGLDWHELQESIKANWEEGGFVRGASTITQQLAKNLYLSTEKSLWRKLKELLITMQLEKHLSKARIFHIYLNVIEFGPGVYGVQAASLYYFGKNVDDLNLEEIIRLTAVIPRPLSIRANGDSRWLKWKSRWILGKLKQYKYISAEQYDAVYPAFRRS